MTPVTRRHDAIEHVDPARHRLQHILGRTDPHQISRSIVGEDRFDLLNHRKHHRLRFPDRQSAYRIAMKTDVHQRPGAGAPQFGYIATLDDAEQHVTRRRALKSAIASLGPAQRQQHRPLDIAQLRRQPHAFIHLHRDVRAEQPLHLDRPLGRELDHGAVDMRAEGHGLLAHLAQLR